VVVDNEILTQLMAMGIAGENGCKRACVATKNAGVEVAVDWVFSHQGDADFDSPLPGEAKVRALHFPVTISISRRLMRPTPTKLWACWPRWGSRMRESFKR